MRTTLKLLTICCISFSFIFAQCGGGGNNNGGNNGGGSSGGNGGSTTPTPAPKTAAIYNVMHNPILPNANQSVTFQINKLAGNIKSAKLFVTVDNQNADGSIAPNVGRALVKSWNTADQNSYSHTVAGGYPQNKFVTYEIEVTNFDNSTSTKIVSFANLPYPVPNKAVPAYLGGSPAQNFNITIIQDEDIASLSTFHNKARSCILGGFLTDTFLLANSNAFNFYINRETGVAAHEGSSLHVEPSNHAHLASGPKIIIHSSNQSDIAYGTYAGAEMNDPATFLHELSHLLFHLSDEYSGGSDLRPARTASWKNVWAVRNWAVAELGNYPGKLDSDIKRITGISRYKICKTNCIMNVVGTTNFVIDHPCRLRMRHVIRQKVGNIPV